MFATFSRSWDIAKLSFRVMREDKELLLFPVFASVFSLLFILVMVFPVFVTALLPEETRALLQLPVLFIVYLGLSFIATFFSVCVVFTTKKRFEGGNATFSESLSFALSKVHLILAWSLVSATVGIILRLIENAAERSRNDIVAMLGRVVSGILGLIWSVITVFVVPAMVYYDVSPFEAIKRSVAAIKKTWGESLVRHYGFGMVQALFVIAGIVATLVLAYVGAMAHPILGLFLAGLGVLYLIAVVVVFSLANSIFNTALFVYAETGKVPGAFEQEMLANAFTPRPGPTHGI